MQRILSALHASSVVPEPAKRIKDEVALWLLNQLVKVSDQRERVDGRVRVVEAFPSAGFWRVEKTGGGARVVQTSGANTLRRKRAFCSIVRRS
jgi:hypothetical protein